MAASMEQAAATKKIYALSLDNIVKSYGTAKRRVDVLRGASLNIAAGEIIGLLAPSGAGKSTLLHIAGLLEKPDSGKISVAGQSVESAPDRLRTAMRRSEIGFVYQFHHLLPEFTAQENVMLPQLANGTAAAKAAARAMNLLERVELGSRASHRPAELSGGEQQRVALCRALANNPRIVLADEPTGNLDPANAREVFSAMLELVRKSDRSFLIATHNTDLAARMDRTVSLENGRLQR